MTFLLYFLGAIAVIAALGYVVSRRHVGAGSYDRASNSADLYLYTSGPTRLDSARGDHF
jgi:hypothetical protein